MGESWRATRDSVRVKSKEKGSVESCGPGKTHAESYTREEPQESHREPQETQSESRSKERDSVESCELGKTHAESWIKGEPRESPGRAIRDSDPSQEARGRLS